ncbi:hypothetical protein IEQ34_020098 [Dendrobium chrysotoxum]|uniref:Uncharacterized protein n=1 Tax=Dendrobium chrysotoxum TaxID=161865 RepID=A0AAV7G021_DENCH|nr:hypothetical protein IEQ34_020098 [Dendrobium chrysotoxum]
MMLNLSPDVDTLQYEVSYLRKYVDEEYLFKVGLSTMVGRSHIHMLRKSPNIPKATIHTAKGECKRKYDGKMERQLAEYRVELEPRDHIYDVEVKALELECMEEGFI